ncbi:putative toxin-antitoxin system toxin component, PIN family [Aquabacterium sp.]|uniref:PIN domain-containing protein n=1 Tax=Aquabacterium sp. TaxID=1872578 RepID=UPI0035B29422
MPPIIILDTNALLDWHLFRDPAMQPIAAAVAAGAVRWVACEAMRREWGLVWPRDCFARWQPHPETMAAAFEPARFVDRPPRGPMRCKDPEDQVFIDLALAVGARWLISKDAALLKLARRARAVGLEIVPAARWSGLPPPDSAAGC